MIPSDKNDTGHGPELDKDHPHGVTEGTLVVVGDAHTQGGGSLLASLIDQGSRHDVLDPRACVAPRDAHQELQAVGSQGNGCGR